MDRQSTVIRTAETAAMRAVDPVERCAWWLGVDRQAAGYERYLRPWIPGVGFDGAIPAIAVHRSALRAHCERAAAALARFEPGTIRCAHARLGLRVAIIGKGGAGKTVLAATLARELARRGRRVLAADLDTNPGLAMSLGMAPTDAGLPPEAIEQREGANYGWQLAGGLSPTEAVERFSTPAPDGVRYLGVGKIRTVDKEAAKQSVPAIVQILLGVDALGYDVIADLEAGPTTPFERYHGFAADAMVVVGPAWRSAMTARRLLPMVAGINALIIASRWRDEPDHPDLAPWARIPYDECVREAERRDESPIDACPGAPAVQAVKAVADRLLFLPG